jgi:hypothetical protein
MAVLSLNLKLNVYDFRYKTRNLGLRICPSWAHVQSDQANDQ